MSGLSSILVTVQQCAICNTVHLTCPWERMPSACESCGYALSREGAA